MTFDQEGQLNGNAGCNDYFASYKVDGNKLTISDSGATLKLCEEDVMAEETAFLAALNKVVSYQITGNSLQVRDAEDNILIAFTRK
jgi:heat shock protein HslJ